MATNLRIIHTTDFIKVTPDGTLDLDESKKLLIEIASVQIPSVDYELILDTRKAQVAMSITDLWYLAAELSKLHKSFSKKTVVLCPLKEFDQAGFFALCAQNRGLQIRAFTSFEDAIEWLIAGRTDVVL